MDICNYSLAINYFLFSSERKGFQLLIIQSVHIREDWVLVFLWMGSSSSVQMARMVKLCSSWDDAFAGFGVGWICCVWCGSGGSHETPPLLLSQAAWTWKSCHSIPVPPSGFYLKEINFCVMLQRWPYLENNLCWKFGLNFLEETLDMFWPGVLKSHWPYVKAELGTWNTHCMLVWVVWW